MSVENTNSRVWKYAPDHLKDSIRLFMNEIDTIVDYFLRLFSYRFAGQLADQDSTRADRIPNPHGQDHIYELRLKTKNGVEIRRMSLSHLGESVESKSSCYKIIYDDQMVLKIPPKPIDDFSLYLDKINRERMVSQSLCPLVPCVTPDLATILTKVPGLRLNPPRGETIESECLSLLKSRPQYRSYLMIKDGFVFFMNLSKYAFFNQVVERMYDEKSRIQHEIIRNMQIFDHLQAFETIYGDAHDEIFFNINRLFLEFEKTVDRHLTRSPENCMLPAYRKKEWFFQHLAAIRPETDPQELERSISVRMNQDLMNLMGENKSIVNEYRKIVYSHVRTKIFENHKSRFESLIINILKLLNNLQKQKVAARDLKLDNIFISAEPDAVDQLLRDPRAYDLGLIDLETAIRLDTDSAEPLAQPALAGTPSYMTPSHLFKNRTLARLFGNHLPYIFYLQDWYASVGMIYKVATGRTLFAKTSRLIPQIIQIKRAAITRKISMRKVLQTVSHRFWKSASQELNEVLHENEALCRIQVKIPYGVVEMFDRFLQQEEQVISNAIDRYFRSQPALQKFYTPAADGGPVQLKANWEKKIFDPKVPSKFRNEMIRLIKEIERLKKIAAYHDQLRSDLEQQHHRRSPDENHVRPGDHRHVPPHLARLRHHGAR